MMGIWTAIGLALVAQGKPNPKNKLDKGPVDLRGAIVDSLDAGAAAAANLDRVILYFAYHIDTYEGFDPSYITPDVREFIRRSVILVMEPFDPSSEIQKRLGIRGPGVLCALDKYENDLGLRASGGLGAEKIISLGREALVQVKNTEAQIKSLSDKVAEFAAKGDIANAVSTHARLAAWNKKGYPEIAAAKTKIDGLAESGLVKGRVLLTKNETEKEGTSILESMARAFRGLPQAQQAEIELAKHFAGKGMISAAKDRIDHVLRSDSKINEAEIRQAGELWVRILKDGIEGIRAAVRSGFDGDLDVVKEKINKIKKDYAGTDVAKHAAEVLSDLVSPKQ